MEITFIENGRTRKGIIVQCQVCGKDVPSRKDDIRKFCSPACYYLNKRKKIKIECAYCKKECEKTQSKLNKSKSGLYFCSRKCKDQAQRIGGIEQIMPPHYGQSNGYHLCERLLNEEGVCCVGCGDNRRFLLCVHHIDGDRENNTAENLEVLCGNCHIIRHLVNKNGMWVYNTKALTPRHLISEVYNTGV